MIKMQHAPAAEPDNGRQDQSPHGEFREQNAAQLATRECILVCLSSSPSNEKVIRAAAQMAKAFAGSLTALFVETPDYAVLPAHDKAVLQENMRTARQFGANIEIAYGDDTAFQIAEYARLSGVTKIVMGQGYVKNFSRLLKQDLAERLSAYAPHLEIHVLPDRTVGEHFPKKAQRNGAVISMKDIAVTLACLVLASLIGVVFEHFGIDPANIITVYILGALVVSILTTRRALSIAFTAASVLIFNFLFIEPRFSFNSYSAGYPLTFVVMFISSFLTGSLATRLKNNARQSARVAYRTQLLFETNQLLQQEKTEEGIVSATSRQLMKLLSRNIVFYRGTAGKGKEPGRLGEPIKFAMPGSSLDPSYTSENERAVAAWALDNNRHAGATTGTLSSAKCLYLSVRTGSNVYGVIGIVVGKEPLDAFENSITLSILGECALALENIEIEREKEEAAVLAKNEQLRANLLRSISHDLRTPLTSISGNASNLISNGTAFDEATRQRLYRDIYDDALWLINLVENLLAITRAEEGRMQLHLSAELMEEVIDEALRHISRQQAEHRIVVEETDELILARIDARLIVQVIINLVDNAIKYTPPGSEIRIRTRKEGAFAALYVADNGPGISDEAKDHVFEMFYTGANKIADSRRSLGLGLALCRTIVNAHGGEISVSDAKPHGCIFKVTLPAGEVHIHE